MRNDQKMADQGTIQRKEIWGVLGGMGPLASAEFMKTIYEESISEVEQESPTVLLLSDPSVPDRTECLRNGGEQILLEHLHAGIGQLAAAGATRIVICCITVHALWRYLEEPVKSRLVSLIDLTFSVLLRGHRRSLLLCTEGTRAAGIFQNHASWHDARELMVLPDAEDQARIHRLIYEIKTNHMRPEHLQFVESLARKYQADSYTAGCTELHILVREHSRTTSRRWDEFCIDPLARVAAMMSRPDAGAAQEIYALDSSGALKGSG